MDSVSHPVVWYVSIPVPAPGWPWLNNVINIPCTGQHRILHISAHGAQDWGSQLWWIPGGTTQIWETPMSTCRNKHWVSGCSQGRTLVKTMLTKASSFVSFRSFHFFRKIVYTRISLKSELWMWLSRVTWRDITVLWQPFITPSLA